uniref:Variant surface glycoprotein (VSG), putative n=1 Tax=Trypanosoma brucei brucei (strain 927/4 GUTat10.1) TaxID=185431 RepID=Q4FKV8_TRYB2|nr:variant surface glycoprotein (VSG), putative [Trypanosoma brucei brucei TREU927]
MYWVVFLVAVLHSGHQALGKEEIVNEQEFHALCRMINWAEKGLKHITLARQVTEEAQKIGLIYLEAAVEDEVTVLIELQEKACMSNEKRSHEKNCGLYKTFWQDAQKASKRTARSSVRQGVKNSLETHTMEDIKERAMEAADIYHEIEAKSPSEKLQKTEGQLNQALYGVSHSAEEIRAGGDRGRVCGQSLHSAIVVGGQSLAMDFLCLCAMHRSWSSGKSVCCTDCTTGDNREEWNPESNGAQRWDFLKQKCADDNSNQHDKEERLRGAEDYFVSAVTKTRPGGSSILHRLGEKKNNQVKGCNGDKNRGQGICVQYGSDNGAALPWMKALDGVEKTISDLARGRQEMLAKLERIKELSQEIEKLIKGDTGRGRQRGRQKRSVNPENSVPENPTAPSDSTQSTTHTDEKKRSVRKPISTGNGASKSYGSEEDDSYEYECEEENSACSDSPAKPTVKNSKSAINCPLGLILLLV